MDLVEQVSDGLWAVLRDSMVIFDFFFDTENGQYGVAGDSVDPHENGSNDEPNEKADYGWNPRVLNLKVSLCIDNEIGN